jgi:hypothetical protein
MKGQPFACRRWAVRVLADDLAHVFGFLINPDAGISLGLRVRPQETVVALVGLSVSDEGRRSAVLGAAGEGIAMTFPPIIVELAHLPRIPRTFATID